MSHGATAYFSLVALIALSATPAARGQTHRISGRVVDAQQRPVAGAVVARQWAGSSKQMQPTRPMTSGPDGTFSGDVISIGQPIALVALHAEHGWMGVRELTEAELSAPITMQVGPAVVVRGSVLPPAAGEGTWRTITLTRLPGRQAIYVNNRLEHEFDFLAPPGRYELSIVGSDIQRFSRELSIATDSPTLDLGAVEVNAIGGALSIGADPPPLRFTAARGVPETFSLSDLRGKWVVIEFWGYWCAGCVRGSLPKLMRMADSLKPYGDDRFAIITVHDARARSIEEVDRRLEQLSRELWEGRKLPFPVLLDGAGETVRNWGVRGFPTLAVIDPAGKVLTVGVAIDVEPILRKRLETPASRPAP
ncbi:MAG: Thiol-disulfide oxidoreductase ResA [Phycisphaerae bacterium]|nr:Thiol-disulfide oxidoreductase ResA [Phycisphaerae bacterium]